jgi:hypothetical protein
MTLLMMTILMMTLQTHIASRSLGVLLHVFETTIVVPKFSVFKHLDHQSVYLNNSSSEYQTPSSQVTIDAKLAVDGIYAWIQSIFLVPKLIKVRVR